uniref:Histone deacetylase interacting domain-containing protein n=1 Tax=Kalanchoe fedtschenkoi TaxID=63787 RepID=A0A7N0ZWS8_KALFE
MTDSACICRLGPELEESIQYLAALKATLTPDEYSSLLKIVDDFRKKRCDFGGVRVRAKELLKENRYLTRAFNVFVHKEDRLEVPPPSNDVTVDLPSARRFLYKIKRCMAGSNKILDSFLLILQNLGEEGKSLIQIFREVAFLLGHNQGLLLEFTNFLPDSLRPTASVSSSSEWKDLVQLMSSAVKETKDLPECMWNTELLTFCHKLKAQLSAEDYQKFLEYLKTHSNNGLSSSDLQDLVGDLLADDPAIFEEFKIIATSLKKNSKLYLKRDKKGKFLSSDEKLAEEVRSETEELAVESDIYRSRCFIGTPSYQLLPEISLKPELWKRRKVEEEVLNDYWVSAASGSEDRDCALRSRNPFEDKLFKCEDKLYEMDLLLDNGSSVISQMRLLQEKITDPRIKIKIPIRLEEHFKAMNIRFIKRVFRDESSKVLDSLRENPRRALPAVLERMTEQRQQWVEQREECSKVSADVMRKNHHKALAHRVFFKRQDGRKMSAIAVEPRREEEEKKAAVLVGGEDKLASTIRKRRSSWSTGAASSGSRWIKGSEVKVGVKDAGRSIVKAGVKDGGRLIKGSEAGAGVKDGVSHKTEKISFFLGTRDLLRPKRPKK